MSNTVRELVGEIDWNHFTRYSFRGLGRLPILFLLSTSLYLGLHNYAEFSPEAARQLHEDLVMFSIGGTSVDLLSIWMGLVLLWVTIPLLQAMAAFNPLLEEVKRD